MSINKNRFTRLQYLKRSIPKLYGLIVFCLLLASPSCTNSDSQESSSSQPDYSGEIDNLTLISPEDGAVPDSVRLTRETVFESNGEVYIEGRISNFSVDDLGRVYIAATQMGRLGIYVFEPDGEFITRMAPYGRGPGEYESIRSIDVHNNQLYLLDARLQKYGVFELNGFTHVKDQVITRNRLTKRDSLANVLHLYDLVVTDDDSFILKLRMLPRSRRYPDQPEVYYAMDRTGAILPGEILKQKGLTYYFPKQGIATPYLMPFSLSSLVSVTNDGRFYTARTSDFLIKEYDQTGTYQRAMLYPFDKAALSLEDISLEKSQLRMLDQYELPGTWPALHTMELDDEGRLWVATITESDSTFQWHVIDETGTRLARFILPGNRASRSAFTKPLVMIKNGHFYHKERDAETGLERIVKYRVRFVSR